MYYRHFGLSGAPFQFTPSPQLLFTSKAHRETRAALEWNLQHGPSGFSLLIGETGTGKTTLIISLLAQNHSFVRIAYISNPKLGYDGFLRDIACQLGVTWHADRLEMFYAFERFLEALSPRERVVVMVDEAQALSDEMLDDLRLFANRNIRNDRFFHLVFAGQPDLLSRLKTPGLRQLNERIGVRMLLNRLEATEARAYVEYRLAAFGGNAEAVFARGALERLLTRGGQIPRRINMVCHSAMLRAYHAGESRVSLESARAATLELDDRLAADPHVDRAPAVSSFVHRRLQALGSMRDGLAPAVIAATLAITGIGMLYLWNSTPTGRNDSANAMSSVNSVIESPGSNAAMGFSVAAMSSVDGTRQQMRRVRVRAGDTLLGIARDNLGSKDDLDRLIKANPQIRGDDRIYPGEMLTLPPPSSSRSGTNSVRQTASSEVRPGLPAFSDGE
jgi:MSHA biogenesis protein MshM